MVAHKRSIIEANETIKVPKITWDGSLDPVIKSYHLNSFPSTTCNNNYDVLPRQDTSRKAHHLSEITVLNADGRRYVYGIPVYNRMQTEVSAASFICNWSWRL